MYPRYIDPIVQYFLWRLYHLKLNYNIVTGQQPLKMVMNNVLEFLRNILEEISLFLGNYLTKIQINFLFIAPVISLIVWAVWKCFFSPGKSLVGKHVVVIGGASRLGRLVAVEAGKQGAHVSILGRESITLFATKERIIHARMSSSQIVTYVVTDVDKFGDLRAAFKRVNREAGAIDILVNCEVSSVVSGLIEHTSHSRIRNMFQTNLIGTMNVIRLAIGDMKRRKKGSIVLMGSDLCLMGMYGYTAYAACKFAIRGLAESIRMELKPFNVKVTLCIYPETNTAPNFEIENRFLPLIKKKSTKSAKRNLQLVAERILKDAMVSKIKNVGFYARQ